MYKKITDFILCNLNNHKGITFISEDCYEKFISYSELFNKAITILGHMQSLGLKPADKAVFQLGDNQDFLTIFWACILGGIIPIPLTIGTNTEHRLKLFRVWQVLDRAYLVTDQKTVTVLNDFALENGFRDQINEIQQKTILIDEFANLSNSGKIWDSFPEDIAFIQFSSGSTGQPKGVILTHENLITNVDAILSGIHCQPTDSTLSWMPLTHDMGLIGFHLAPMAGMINQCIMSTSLFIRRPILWLEKASKYQITLLSSPNFGYKYFLDSFSPEVAKNWDLSHVRLIFNGAEPISPSISKRFFSVLKDYGLKSNSAFPVYGLAEASLAVTFPPLTEELISYRLRRKSVAIGERIETGDENDSVEFVDLGYPVKKCFLRICNDEGNNVAEGVIGHIQISGKNVTKGYYNNPTATKELITLDGWLLTGDLGFLENGRLVVTGRAKDIIFVNGQNYYAHDLERVVEMLNSIELGEVVAGSVFNDKTHKDEVIVFVLFKKSLNRFVQLAQDIQNHIGEYLGLKVAAVIPVKKIPKTTSGKIQRYKMIEDYYQGKYSSVLAEFARLQQQEIQDGDSTIKNEIEKRLVEIFQDVLGISGIGVNTNIFGIGCDSLKATILVSKIQKEFQKELTLARLFQLKTVKGIVNYLEQMENITYTPIVSVAKEIYYPLSSAQKRLFVLNQIEGDNVTYNITGIMTISGTLDVLKLENLFQELINRHESFRTSFAMIDGKPVQRIHDELRLKVTLLHPEQEIEKTIQEFIKPFDLTKAPLLRLGLIKISECKHVLIVDMHHIISDGSSINIIVNEFVKLYKDQVLPELQIQYKDYVVWQQKRDLESDQPIRNYWLSKFQDEIPILNLPIDFPRPFVQSFKGEHFYLSLSSEITTAVNRFLQETGTTLYMFLLTIYNVFLLKYTGQEDFVVGTPVSGRFHADLQNIIGMFVNTLAMRNYPSGKKTFLKFLGEVKQNCLEAFENQDFQFEMLVEALNIKRDLARNPLFDTMFVLQNTGELKVAMKDLQFEPYQFFNPISKFDLTIFATPEDDRILFGFEYCTSLFKRATIEQFAKHFINLISNTITQSNLPIAEIEMMSQPEQSHLLYGLNETSSDYPKLKIVNQLFEEQVEKNPLKTALEYEDQKLTYQQLNEKSNQLARMLIEKGVKPNTIVAVLAHRSFEFIIAIFGIIKAGGAYLPIDPLYPKDRIEYMLGDSAVEIVLTEESFMDKIQFGGQVIYINNPDLYQGCVNNPEKRNKPDDLIYIIYTSGSTGYPKGAMLEHQGVVNYIWWAIKSYFHDAAVSFPLFTSISFDLTVTSIFAPLLSGNKVVIYGEDPKGLLIEKIFKEQKVNIVKLTPAHLRLIREMDNSKSTVKTLIVGGEQLERELAHDIYRRFEGKINIFNEYGPTETVVGCMIYRFDPQKDTRIAVPIGKPADNVQIYVLDQYLKPTPFNTEGELYISGDGVGRGYIHKQELTKAKFISNPFLDGHRMYKTGDLAKVLPDGNIEYIGRIDQQVKIRGYRIELEEIESHLLKYDSIKWTAVIDRQNGNSEKYLCAYLVADTKIDTSQLKKYLMNIVPEYMVPGFIIQLDKIPLTPNGKIDRKALPEPDIEIKRDYISPSNDVERRIIEVWQDILGIEKIGVQDNFFSLGGDSIKAIQVVSRLNQSKIEISVKDIILYQTVAELSAGIELEEVSQHIYEQGLISGSVGLTPIMQWFFEHQSLAPHYYNQSVVLKLKPDIDIKILEQAFLTLIMHHDGLRLNFNPIQQGMFFNHDNLERFDINVVDISGLSEADQQKRFIEIGLNLKSSFNISKDLLIRASVIKFGNGNQELLITAHHLVIDAVSWRILLEDLYSCYKTLQQESGIYEPRKTASLKDWYQTLLNYAQRPELAEEIPYWNKIIQTQSVLPQDDDTDDWSMNTRATSAIVFEGLEIQTTIEKSYQMFRATIQDLLLTVLSKTIKEWAGIDTVCVEMESHGRVIDDINLSRTIGWFTAIYPVKLNQKGDLLHSQITEIKELVKTIPNHGIGYGILKYFQHMFSDETGTTPDLRLNYLGQFDNELNNDIFTYSTRDSGSDYGDECNITAKFEWNCMIVGKTLKVELNYNRKAYREASIERLISIFRNTLVNVFESIEKMSNSDIYYSPSDFKMTDISQEDLDSLFQ